MVSFILPGNSATGGYDVANSCRFNSGSTDHLDRTFGSAGNRRTFTVSFWLKTTTKETYNTIFDSGADGSNSDDIYFHTGRLNFSAYYGSTQFMLRTKAKYRDPSAWTHFVVAFDTTQSTASNRLKMYANGTQITEFDDETSPSQNFQTSYMNLDRLHNIGTLTDGDNFPLDGYLAEMVFIDGQALDPTSFGEFDEDSPTIWKPIDLSGLTFGTNGFYLDFENSSSLGADQSGNSNDFTARNLTSVDQSTDTCTNNFATLNPLEAEENSPTFSDGNLTQTTPNSGASGGRSTIEIPHTGVWYWEVKIVSTTGTIGDNLRLGISNDSPSSNSGQLIKYMSDGQSQIPGSSSSYGASYAAGDIIGIKVDADSNQVTFYKNGATQGAISYTMVDGETYKAVVGEFSNTIGCVYSMNFGNAPFSISSGNSDPNGYGNFEYSTDSGYALNTKNLAEFG